MPDIGEQDTVEIRGTVAEAKTEPPRPFSALVEVDVAALSDRGKVRSKNEDHFLVARGTRSFETVLSNLPADEVPDHFNEVVHGLVVADGMGGMAAGEVASRLAIRTLINLILHVPDWIMRVDEEKFADEALRRAAERYKEVDAFLKAQGEAKPRLAGMGTTMTLARIVGADLFLTHVGDSRAYLYRQDCLWQLTSDHTLAAALAKLGQISREEVATHRLRHVLTKALGIQSGDVEAEVHRVELADDDGLLLCTDGLTEMVDDLTIADVLGRRLPAADTCRQLMDLALDRGGKDNVTVIFAWYRLPAKEAPSEVAASA